MEAEWPYLEQAQCALVKAETILKRATKESVTGDIDGMVKAISQTGQALNTVSGLYSNALAAERSKT